MDEETVYSITTDTQYGALERIEVGAIAAACPLPWWNQTLCEVNDCVVRLGVLHGAFHWHVHEKEDEFFYVLEGRLLVDLPEETLELTARQGLTVPRRVRHRTRAPERTVVLMIEGATITPTGDGTSPGSALPPTDACR